MSSQELVDAARSGLLSNQHTLANLQSKAGVPVEACSEDDVFHAAMAEFDRVLRLDVPGEALNHLSRSGSCAASDCKRGC